MLVRLPGGKDRPGGVPEIAYWLSGSGRLIFDREPDKYYLARLSGGPPMSQHLKYGEFTITWSYNLPFAFGKTITEPLKNGENVIDYQGRRRRPLCVIKVRNTSENRYFKRNHYSHKKECLIMYACDYLKTAS